MTDPKILNQLSLRAARRLVRQVRVSGFLTALTSGAFIALPLLVAGAVAGRVYQSIDVMRYAAAAAALVFLAYLLVGVARSLRFRASELEGAKIIDDELGLKDHLSSALSFEQQSAAGPLVELTIEEARARAAGVDLGRALPLRIPRAAWSLPFLGFIAAALIITMARVEPAIANTRVALTDPEREARDRELLDEVRQGLAKVAKDIEEESARDGDELGQKAARALKRTSEELNPENGADRKSALRKLADTKKELEKQNSGLDFEERLAQALRFLVRSRYTRPVARKLQVQDVDGAIAATAELGETLPTAELDDKERDKLATNAGQASDVLMPTRLRPLAQALSDLAQAVRKKDSQAIARALEKMAKKLEELKKLRKSRARTEKALRALDFAKLDLSRGRESDTPFQDFKIPDGQGNRGDGERARALPIRPGPMRPGGGQNPQGQGAKPPQYLGPCSLNCAFEGQCIKCPCRGKKICPKDKRPCPCFYCQAQQGNGQGQQGQQGQGQNQGQGQGKGNKPGWGSEWKEEKNNKRRGALGKESRVKGLLGKQGESAIMAVKTANDGSKAGANTKEIFQRYRKVEEESLYREKVPLSKRDLVRKYFDAIKPKDE